MANDIQTYLKYANLQMAAEAIYPIASTGSISPSTLTNGNNRSSKFTEVQATEFASKYTVVSHRPNTATGFSGTLFRDNTTGELIMSFRSTEFADDAAATTRPPTRWRSKKKAGLSVRSLIWKRGIAN